MNLPPVPVLNFQTQDRSTLPRLGKANWISWLSDQGYGIEDRIALIEDDPNREIELYCNLETNVWAMYHPVYQGLPETECLYLNIPTEEQARNLVEIALNMTQVVDLARLGQQFVQAKAQGQSEQQLYLWHCHHPRNWKPDKISGKSYTEPPIAGENFYFGEAQDEQERFDGYLFGTRYPELPILTEDWATRGWQFKATGTVIEIAPGLWQQAGTTRTFSFD